MKTYYKINEISKLYAIGQDSLRYYEEIGILQPIRDKNNYRQYTTKDIYRLNVIKDLRNLGFSMSAIREYLDRRSIVHSISIMEQENQIIDEKIHALEQLKKDVKRRERALRDSQLITLLKMELQDFPQRKCVTLKTDIVQDDAEFRLVKLSKEYEKNIFIIANFNTGFMIDITNPEQIHPSSVFLAGDTLETYEFTLPAGSYLTMYYPGMRDKQYEHVKEMLNYCKKNHLIVDSYALEFFIIDSHETKNQEEFITQLQMKVMEST